MTVFELGALGEFVGAIAVVVTLMFLAFQVRHSRRAVEESNRLERVSAIDRHTDSISRWRGRLMENDELARIWLVALTGGELSDAEGIRLDNLWIDFVSIQRTSFVRANVVGEEGLARVSVLSVATHIKQSSIVQELWEMTRPWNALTTPDFVKSVEDELSNLDQEITNLYRLRS